MNASRILTECAARTTRTSRVGGGNLIGWQPNGHVVVSGTFLVLEVGMPAPSVWLGR